MNKVILAILGVSLTACASAATVTSAPLEKAPFDSKKPLYIDKDGGHACPEGFDLYVRALKPEPTKDKDGKPTPAPQGDYESFYFARSAQPTTPAIIVTRPGIQEYTPACLQVK
jgi:hypothetical protein